MKAYNDLPKGTILGGRYTIFQRIGLGRSSAVYEALDAKSQSSVALKILDPFIAQDAVSVERFVRESKILRHLEHPGVIKIFDVFTEGDYKAIVMEHFPSKDGAQLLKEKGRLDVADFLPLAARLIEILQSCHQKGIIHRDLKPQNILFGADGHVKIVDFGISRMNSMSDLTKTGTILGTAEYMPPEAFLGAHGDPRGDLYSLGCVFFELLAGAPPYSGFSLQQIMSAQAKGEIRSLSKLRDDIPAWLEDVIAKCLRTRMTDRYQNAADLQADLRAKERAIARFDKEALARSCLVCQQKMLAGLSFCHACGKFQSEVYQPGPSSVILHQVERKAEIEKHLLASFPTLSVARVRKLLDNTPGLLMRGVSSETARIVSNEFYGQPVRLQIVTSVPKEFALTTSYYAIAFCGLLPLFVFPKIALPLKLVLIGASEVGLFAWFARKTVPLIQLKALKARKSTVPPAVIEIASKVAKIGDIRLQEILGSIALHVQARSGGEKPLSDIALKGVRDAVEFAEKTSLHAAYLAGRNVADIKKQLEVHELKLKRAVTAEESDELIRRSAALREEYRNYRTAQDLYADGVAALLSFHEHLKQTAPGSFEWRRLAPPAEAA